MLSEKRIAELKAIKDKDIDLSDCEELGEDFFASARHTRPGAKIIEAVDKEGV